MCSCKICWQINNIQDNEIIKTRTVYENDNIVCSCSSCFFVRKRLAHFADLFPCIILYPKQDSLLLKNIFSVVVYLTQYL